MCILYTQLTKLLNLIALLGIIPSCGIMTLFLDLWVVVLFCLCSYILIVRRKI